MFLGKELGGRPTDRNLYRDGVADYEKMSKTNNFRKGLERVLEGAKKYRVALMCSEQNPLDCHRCLLVSRILAERGVSVGHILADGTLLDHNKIEDTLLGLCGRSTDDFFATRTERLAMAYRERAQKVAFAESQKETDRPVAAE